MRVKCEDLITGNTYNLLGIGEYGEADKLSSFFKIFNVGRFYSVSDKDHCEKTALAA